MHRIRTLENGLRIIAHPMAGMESVAIGVWVRAGGRYEDPKEGGISHLLEHLLFKGTKTRDMMTIKQEIEGRGGSFNGFTAEEHTCYLVKILGRYAGLGAEILSDMVLNPRLDEAEMAKEKDVIVEEINMYKDMPSHYVHEILAEEMWPSQPLGMPLAGTVESVRGISRDNVVSYKKGYYNPRNIFLVGAGNIEENALVDIARKFFSEARPGDASRFEKAGVSQVEPRLNIHSKKTEQTHIALGFHTPDRFHPDKHVMSIINTILGANMSSRLFHIVRDEMALCYEISSSVRRYEDCGAFVVSAGVDDRKLVKAVEIILRELGRITKEPITSEELRRAKEYYKGQLLFALEDTMSHMLWLGEKVVAGEKDLNSRKILEKIEAVTENDVMRVSQGIFRGDNINLAVIGPANEGAKVKEVMHF
ncbi:MAG: insulinase family protein [Candidatus Omnitrophica bacterium]|nr:insulinase family protein [Candidatus Omnitrophota bacterium]